MNRLKQIGLLALALIWLVARSSADSSRPDFQGKITHIHLDEHRTKRLGTVVVDAGTKSQAHQYNKIILIVTRETHICEQTEQERRKITFDELKVGDLIEAQFTGPMMESLPGQVVAAEIVVLQSSQRQRPDEGRQSSR